MKNFKVQDYFPLGFDGKREINWFSAALACMGVYSLSYFYHLSEAYNNLFYRKNGELYIPKYIPEGRVMPDFVHLIDGSFPLFWVIAVIAFAMIFYHYSFFHMGSKSIYTMRRLPSRWELHKRCISAPLAILLISMLLIVIITIIYYIVYLLITPEQCFVHGQWQRFFTEFFGGVIYA